MNPAPGLLRCQASYGSLYIQNKSQLSHRVLTRRTTSANPQRTGYAAESRPAPSSRYRRPVCTTYHAQFTHSRPFLSKEWNSLSNRAARDLQRNTELGTMDWQLCFGSAPLAQALHFNAEIKLHGANFLQRTLQF